MKKAVTASSVCAAVGLIAIGVTTSVRSDEGAVARGARIAALGNGRGTPACASCHSVNGVGDPSGAFPRLTGQPAHYLWHALETFADGERRNAVMSPIAAALTENERQDVAAYYAAQNAPVPPFRTLDPSLVAEGRNIAGVGLNDQQVPACAACHGPAGRTVNPTVPNLAGQYAGYVTYALKMFSDDYRKNDQMNGIAHVLTPEQVRAVSEYFQQVDPGPGRGVANADMPPVERRRP